MEAIKLYRECAQEVEKEWQRIVEEAGGEEHVAPTDRHAHELLKTSLKIDLDKRLNRED